MHSLMTMVSLFGNLYAHIAYAAQREHDILRVCLVYPHKVSTTAMDAALNDLCLNPRYVYEMLSAGATFPSLDARLAAEWRAL